MESKQQQQQFVEEYEDLTGVGAPKRNETRQQYLARRHKEEEETRSVFYREGLKGGLIFSGVATAGVAAGCFASPTFKKSVTWNIRTFIISSAFISGYWIFGEKSSVKVMHERVNKEMEQYYNHPNEQQKN